MRKNPAPSVTDGQTIRSLIQGPGQAELVRAHVGQDGKRRIAERGLGTVTHTQGGVRVVIPAHGIDRLVGDQVDAMALANELLA